MGTTWWKLMSRRFRICMAKVGRESLRPSYGRPKLTLISPAKNQNLLSCTSTSIYNRKVWSSTKYQPWIHHFRDFCWLMYHFRQDTAASPLWHLRSLQVDLFSCGLFWETPRIKIWWSINIRQSLIYVSCCYLCPWLNCAWVKKEERIVDIMILYIDIYMTQLLLLGKFEYTGGPIFNVVLEC